MEEKAHVNKMGVMPVKRLLIEMAWPAVLSMTINALYNIVDSIFVAKISEDALTAVSIVNPIQMLIIALSAGSGVGINSLIARKLGAKKQEEADQAASTGLRIGLLNYVVFLIIGVCFTGIFVSGYAEKGTYIYEEAVKYMAIVCIGSFFLNMQVVLEKILQATGNMIYPMIFQLIGAVGLQSDRGGCQHHLRPDSDFRTARSTETWRGGGSDCNGNRSGLRHDDGSVYHFQR